MSKRTSFSATLKHRNTRGVCDSLKTTAQHHLPAFNLRYLVYLSQEAAGYAQHPLTRLFCWRLTRCALVWRSRATFKFFADHRQFQPQNDALAMSNCVIKRWFIRQSTINNIISFMVVLWQKLWFHIYTFLKITLVLFQLQLVICVAYHKWR